MQYRIAVFSKEKNQSSLYDDGKVYSIVEATRKCKKLALKWPGSVYCIVALQSKLYYSEDGIKLSPLAIRYINSVLD